MGARGIRPEGADSATSRLRPIITIAALAVLLAGLGLAQTSSAQNALRALGIIDRSTPFTELAFVQPGGLPSSLGSGTTVVKAPFVIRNQTEERREYPWIASISSESDRGQILARGTTSVEPAKSTTVDPSLRFRCLPARTKVTVALAGTDQEISFWVTCSGQTR